MALCQFKPFINRRSCLHNSSYISQGILMKLSSYCFHDLKMIIFYRGHAQPIFTRVTVLNGDFLTVSLVSATPLAIFSRFYWNLPVIVTTTWRGSYYTEVMLYCFLPELWPFISFSHLSKEILVSATPPTFLKGYWWNVPVLVSKTWRRSYFIEVMLNWFLPQLRSFGNFLTKSLVCATPLAVFSGF